MLRSQAGDRRRGEHGRKAERVSPTRARNTLHAGMWEPRSLLAAQLSNLHVDEETDGEASLAKLPAEIINVIAEKLHDALRPHHIVRLSCTCSVIKVAVKDALTKLRADKRAADELPVVICTCSTTRFYQELYWQKSNLSPEAAPALLSIFRSEALLKLDMLYLWKNDIGDDGARAIATAAAAGGLPQLHLLHLASTQIGPDGIRALGSAFAGGAFRHLDLLNLSHNPIGDTGLMHLATELTKNEKYHPLPALRKLLLNYSAIGDCGLLALSGAAAGGRLPKLAELYIHDNAFGDTGLEFLAGMIEDGKLPSLRQLVVDEEYEEHVRLKLSCEARRPRVQVGRSYEAMSVAEWKAM